MIKKIKHVLNNENAGPSLEHMIGITISALFLAKLLQKGIVSNTKQLPRRFVPMVASWDDSFR